MGSDSTGDYRNLVIDGYFAEEVLVTHELGYLLGLHHNSTEAPDSYGVGHIDNEGKFYTIMNYGRSDYVREWVFSSALLL